MALWAVQPHGVQELPLALLCPKSRIYRGLEGRATGGWVRVCSRAAWAVGTLHPSVGLGRDIWLLLCGGLGMEGHFGGFILLTEESITA